MADLADVTPEMIEAGVEILRDFHWGEDDAKEFTARIWAVMEATRQQRSSTPTSGSD